MSAKEMFKRLGFIQKIEENRIIYTYETFMDVSHHIWFDLEDKTLNVWTEDNSVFCESNPFEINLDELKAINKQIEELRWNK